MSILTDLFLADMDTRCFISLISKGRLSETHSFGNGKFIVVIWFLLHGQLLLTTLVFMNIRFFLSAAFRKQTGDREASQVWTTGQK